MKVGDLVLDHYDGEVGLVVCAGPGFHVEVADDHAGFLNGLMPSWKVSWPSIPAYLCDLGQDALDEGLVTIIHEA